MRKQYHFRPSDRGLLAWDVDRLVELTRGLPARAVPLVDLRELNEPYWFAYEGAAPTCRNVVEHMRLIADVDLSFPVILCSQGRVMDGMHRVCRALLEGCENVQALQFAVDPVPDYVGVAPEDLPYPEEPEFDVSRRSAPAIAMTDKDVAALTRLEEALWHEQTRFDPVFMEAVLAPDFIEIGGSGRTYTRQQVLVLPRDVIDAELPLADLHMRLLDWNTAQVTYNSKVTYEGVAEYGRRSSIWSRLRDKWVLRFHQGTPFVP